MILSEGLMGGADGIQGVALGAGAPRWSLGPADLDHPLALGLQERGQLGAVAAGTLHRPTAPTGHLRSGELEQATIAGRVRADRGLGPQAADRVGGGGGQGVAVGVDADHAVDDAGQPGHRHGSSLSWPGRVGPGDHAALL
jgi:hypothetical protein